MGESQDKDIWAIVFSGGAKYLCKLISDPVPAFFESIEAGELMEFIESYEILTHSIPAPGGQGIMRRVISTPVIQTMSPTILYLIVTGVQFLNDMQPEDQHRYKALVESARQITPVAQQGKMDA